MLMECSDYGLTRTLERDNLNLNPLQRGGVLPAAARKALYEFGDGYSVCDYCEGRLDQIPRPHVNSFLDDLADFIKADAVRTVHGAREGKFAVMHALCEEGTQSWLMATPTAPPTWLLRGTALKLWRCRQPGTLIMR